jgi:hypothetical protein
VDNRKHDYLEWLNSRISAETAYHNHKETMAWVATALYLPTIVGLGYWISTCNPSWQIKLVLSILILVGFIVFLCLFINVQLAERWKAAARNEMLTNEIKSLLSGGTCSNVSDDDVYERYKHRYRDCDTRLKTEIATYVMIIGATVIAMFLIWCINCPKCC